ncbi:MAG TPA: uL13 family ribosomal protein [Candidatus Paceibacterota bacterium]|nr:uL13 family ribosomal protein [Candidatus Paceibacterota bacterium]
METKEYIIDASGKRIGRVATEAASVLLGKNTTHFAKNIVEPVTVKIINASKLDISEKRAEEEFQTYSGYPGGRRIETLGHLRDRRGISEVMKRVVGGMLPKNRLHKLRLQNLVVTE